jgi:hypothetical protein
MNNLGGYYAERTSGDRYANIEKSISILQDAQSRTSSQSYPREWSMLAVTLSKTYMVRNSNDGDDIEIAIDLIEEALPVLYRSGLPAELAGTMVNLAVLYNDRVNGDPVQNFERAVAASDLVLDMLSIEKTPVQWAMAQMNRGALFARGGLAGPGQMEIAIASFENALKIYTSEIFPVEYAQVMLNLTQARDSLTVGSKSQHAELALEDAR